jgi:ketopantoate reductase
MTKNTAPRCGVNPTGEPASPKYCIFGAGAIGGTIAAQLARANATVSVIDCGEIVAAIQKDGLRLLINGETLQTSVRASADPAELGPQDYVIIAVKAPFCPRSHRALARCSALKRLSSPR